MGGDPYCGNCHNWMYPLHGAGLNAGRVTWVCDCPMGQEDTSKDPNCHNSNHDHYDPESPIVLSRKAEYEAEEPTPTGVFTAADGGPDNEGTVCGHERLDGRCNFWGCPSRLPTEHPYHVAVFDNGTGEMLGWRPLREPKIDEKTRAELDAILEEANEKVED